jgi:hypothetical protein
MLPIKPAKVIAIRPVLIERLNHPIKTSVVTIEIPNTTLLNCKA